jgi:hypothetical protein
MSDMPDENECRRVSRNDVSGARLPRQHRTALNED